MTFLRRKATAIIGSVLVLLACSAAAQIPAASNENASAVGSTARRSRAPGYRHGVSKPSPAQPPVQQPPPAPPTPEQMAPSPPQVTYSNGLLTIVASNSTLSDILRAVSMRTGASVDAPPQLTAERVAARIGPGSPREVISELLSGPRFDYILVGADGDPNAVRSIILTPNRSSPATGAVMAQRPAAPSVNPPQEEIEDEDSQVQSENPQPVQPPSLPQQMRPQQQFGPQMPPDQMGGQQFSPEGASPGQPPQVKTPEQLLEELRRMQQGNQPQNQPQR